MRFAAKPIMKQRTTVSVETRKVTVVRPATETVEFWCENCRRQVPMFLPEAAARLAQVSPRAIYRLIENNQIHCIETDQGEVFVCARSLNRAFSKAIARALDSNERNQG
jgi:hypothetical protein